MVSLWCFVWLMWRFERHFLAVETCATVLGFIFLRVCVLPDGPTARGAATSWRVFLDWVSDELWFLPLVGIQCFRPTGGH